MQPSRQSGKPDNYFRVRLEWDHLRKLGSELL